MAVGLKKPDSLLPVPGIRLSTVSAGIYDNNRADLALISFSANSSCSAVFTKNAFCAAPVQLARQYMRSGKPQYLIINAGNANAGTGQRGQEDAERIGRALAESGQCPAEAVLPFSTGVIGEYLPAEKICRAIPGLHSGLDEDRWLECAEAIMTTDTMAKGTSKKILIDDVPITITGIAKGSGMIRPDMATMLAFIATDAPVKKQVLDQILNSAMERSFNRISVDGDTSTNDACVLIASGEAELSPITDLNSEATHSLQNGVDGVCRELAQAIVRDGEGASKFITIKVRQGADNAECLSVANAVATSPLVKTAFFASDPNWGRILAVIGRAGLNNLNINSVAIYLDDVCIVEGGQRAADYTEEAGQKVMQQEEIALTVSLGRGKIEETVWTCDLSHGYVKINAEYRT